MKNKQQIEALEREIEELKRRVLWLETSMNTNNYPFVLPSPTQSTPAVSPYTTSNPYVWGQTIITMAHPTTTY